MKDSTEVYVDKWEACACCSTVVSERFVIGIGVVDCSLLRSSDALLVVARRNGSLGKKNFASSVI